MLPRPAMSTLVLFAAVACVAVVTLACDIKNTKYGCKIEGTVCRCNYGCRTEYAYATITKCMDALKERGNNICSKMPCVNGGTCIQIAKEPGFQCRCEGTGYYGVKCDKECPRTPEASGGPFPYECVVI